MGSTLAALTFVVGGEAGHLNKHKYRGDDCGGVTGGRHGNREVARDGLS